MKDLPFVIGNCGVKQIRIGGWLSTIFVISCMIKIPHNESNKLTRSQWTNNGYAAVLVLPNGKM